MLLKKCAYAANPVASSGIRKRNRMGTKVAMSCRTIPSRRLSKFWDEIFNAEAKNAPKNDPSVEPRLFMDMNNAKRVPSIPGGHSWPEIIKKGIILHSPMESQFKFVSTQKIKCYIAFDRFINSAWKKKFLKASAIPTTIFQNLPILGSIWPYFNNIWGQINQKWSTGYKSK